MKYEAAKFVEEISVSLQSSALCLQNLNSFSTVHVLSTALK